MDRTVSPLGEGEVRHVAPQLESLSDLLVHLLGREDGRVGVARDSVGQVQRSPAAGREMVNVALEQLGGFKLDK